MGKYSDNHCSLKCISALMICIVFLFSNAVALSSHAMEKQPQAIKVGVFPYEDQLAVDESGNYSGYGYDYLQEISRYTGWNYEFVDASWSDCLSMLERGDIDLMGAVMPSADRASVFDFADMPMLSGYGVLVTQLDNQTLPYEDFGSFDGLKVGALKNNLHTKSFLEYSRVHGFTPILNEYDSQEAMDAALESGDISAIIMTNLLHSQKLRVVATFGENNAYFATTKGNAAVLYKLNDAMRQISLNDPYFNIKLNQKYYDLQTATAISFSREELDFIESCPPIPCVYIPEALPVSYRDKSSGNVQGVAVDVCRLLEERTSLKFTWIHPKSASEAAAMLSRGDALILPAKYYDLTWAKQNNVLLTEPYLLGQMVMVTDGNSFGPEVVALYDQGSQSRLVAGAVSKGAQLKQYDTIIDCMDAVLKGEANSTFVNSTIASYLVNNPKYAQLQTTPLYGFSADITMAVSGQADPLLLSVLNKGLRNISNTEINQVVLTQMGIGRAGTMATYLYLNPVKTVIGVTGIFAVLLVILLMLLYLFLKNMKKLQRSLYTDELTGRPNYRALSREAASLIGHASEEYALVYLDIHQFKAINDTFGYETGDTVLKAVSDSLWSFVSPKERAARVYADTFVLLLSYTDQDSLRERLDVLSEKLGQLDFEESSSINLLFCGGVYPLPQNLDNLDKACDRANYAKDSISQYFSNTFVFFDDVMRSRVLAEKELEGSMRTALEGREFVPYYQPKVNAITEKVVGAEALVRWIHPEKGMLPPTDFLPFYEKNGFIVKIDLSIFEQVCRDISEWLKKGNQAIPISVNFSRRHMSDSSFPRKLKDIADQYQVPTNLLEVEVTETEALDNVETAVDFVGALKEYGFSISIDDYGTGYSSISFLQQLPLDALKLDRQFILNAMKSDKARDVMRYLVAAMQKNGIRVVCEGVETEVQRDFIISLNCRFIQGYLYSVPLIREEFETFLKWHGVDALDKLAFIPITSFENNRWTGAEDFLTRTLPSWIVSTYLEPGYPVHYISPSFLEGMGYGELEFEITTDGHYINWIHPDDLPLVLEKLEENHRPLKDMTLQYRLRKKSGEYLWIQDVNKHILLDNGREVLLGICTDITGIVNLQAEKSRLIDTIPGGVGELLLTESGPVIQQATDRFYDIIEHTQDEMEALDNNLLQAIYPQDVAGLMDSMQHFIKIGKPVYDCTFRVQHKNKRPHWVSFRSTISGDHSNRQATVIVYNCDKEMKANQQAEIARVKLELALALTGQVAFEYDIQSNTISSQNGFPMCGIPEKTPVNISLSLIESRFVHPDDITVFREGCKKIVNGNRRTFYEIRVRNRPSHTNFLYIWIRITLNTIFDEEHHPVRAVGVIEDINRQKHFEYAFLQEAQYRKAFTESSLMAYELNLTKDTIQRITGNRGFRLQELCEQADSGDSYSKMLVISAKILVAPDDQERFLMEMSQEYLMQLYRDGIYEKELEYRRATLDGQVLWTSALTYLALDQLTGDVIGYSYHRDIHQRKETEKGLIEQAAHDPLTGLYNRTTAEQLIQNFLLRDADSNRLQAFLMLDFDRFKLINDTWGHLNGDKCLVRLAECIVNEVRSDDIVARMGGDEFAILLKNLPDENRAVSIAEKLIQTVSLIGQEVGINVKTSVSIGLAISPRHGTDFEQLYRHADEAMYEAKRNEKTHIVCA